MKRSTCLPFLLFLLTLAAACGTSEQGDQAETPAPAAESPQTAYGSVADVETYLQAINPLVMEHNTLLSKYQEVLASGRDDSRNRVATEDNLAAQAAEVKPSLEALLTEFDAVEPPPLLAPFHRDVRKMFVKRIESMTKTMAGWEAKQAGNESDSIYRDAEATYEEANQITLQLNTHMQRINASMEQAVATP